MRMRKKQTAVGNTEPGKAKHPKKKRRLRILLLLLVLVAGTAAGLRFVWGGSAGAKGQEASYVEETVARRDIINTLTGSGTLQPADSYTVTSLVEAEILTADFEEGDVVSAGDVLYEIDSSNISTSLQQAENSLTQAQKSYQTAVKNLEKLNVKSTISGQVVDIAVEVGDDVSAGQTIATVRDSDTMTVQLYFPSDEAAAFYIGQSAQVTLDGSFETLSGQVTEISAADEVLSGNRIVRKVTIAVSNPGAITDATGATAVIGTSACAQSGTFSYHAEKQITAETSGEVTAVSVIEGQDISVNQILATLSSDSLQDAVESAQTSVTNAELTLENQQSNLDNYTITSPIDGTVIDKNYKQGDNVESSQTMCVIYDLEYLTFTMNVDELDVSTVEVGQTVTITADAVEDQSFEGIVTKVSVNGTTSGGVTTYPVTIRIDETDGLLPGMNVDATINVAEQLDVVAVPAAAVSRGNRVLVKGGEGEAPEETDNAPEGYNWVTVTLGESDGSYVEITDGLSEGDEIAYQQALAASTGEEMTMMPGGNMGGMPNGGGMPSGGGMPGGPGGGF